MTPTDKADLLEEIITEISVYFGMLYLLVEVFKGHSDFADELSTYNYHSEKPTFNTPSSEPRSSFACLLIPSCRGTPRQKHQRVSHQEGISQDNFDDLEPHETL